MQSFVLDLECSLYDTKGKKLFDFQAMAVEEEMSRGGYANGSIATISTIFRVLTDKIYNYIPFSHKAIIYGVEYIVTAKQPYTQRPVGERFSSKPKKFIILSLE